MSIWRSPPFLVPVGVLLLVAVYALIKAHS